MDMNSFIEAVKNMRKMQKEYFKHRNPQVMMSAMSLEKQVDNMLEDMDTPQLFNE